MRVAILLDRWRPPGGGLEVWLGAIAPALAALGHEVLLLARGAEARTPPAARGVPCGGVWPLPRPWRDRVDALARVRAARREGAGAVLDLRASRCPGAVWFAMGGFGPDREAAPVSPRRAALLRLEEESVRVAAAAVAPSPMVARALRAFDPGLAVTVLPLPLIAEPPAAAGPDADALAGRRPLRVLFCGRDPERHGLAAAAEWARALRARWPQLEFEAWSRPGISAPGARMHGWDGGFRAALARADLLLHPTAYDSFSLVCLEAAAAGVPVVTTEQAGVAELLPPESCATAPRADAAAAAAAADRVMRAAVARSAAERAALRAELCARFSLRAHARLLADLLAANPWSG